MIKIFSRTISFATDNSQLRDLNSLENDVNGFLQDPKIISNNVRPFQFTEPMTSNTIFTVLIDYSIKR